MEKKDLTRQCLRTPHHLGLPWTTVRCDFMSSYRLTWGRVYPVLLQQRAWRGDVSPRHRACVMCTSTANPCMSKYTVPLSTQRFSRGDWYRIKSDLIILSIKPEISLKINASFVLYALQVSGARSWKSRERSHRCSGWNLEPWLARI